MLRGLVLGAVALPQFDSSVACDEVRRLRVSAAPRAAVTPLPRKKSFPRPRKPFPARAVLYGHARPFGLAH